MRIDLARRGAQAGCALVEWQYWQHLSGGVYAVQFDVATLGPRTRVDNWLDTYYPGMYITIEKGSMKGFSQRGSKTARLLSTELCGSTWRDVARKLGAL